MLSGYLASWIERPLGIVCTGLGAESVLQSFGPAQTVLKQVQGSVK